MMSHASTHRRGRSLPPEQSAQRLGRWVAALPVAAMVVAGLALTFYCRALLGAAGEGRQVAIGDGSVFVFAGSFVATAVWVIAAHSLRLAGRVAGPEYRLCRALQRIRTGDLGFRVNLRRGDLLGGLALECNDLLDWLNANPPNGARTGTDIVEVAPESEASDAMESETEEVSV